MAYTLTVLQKKCEYLLHLQKLLTFFHQNTCKLDIVLIEQVTF